MSILRSTNSLKTLALLMLLGAAPQAHAEETQQPEPNDFVKAFKDSKILFDARIRYEFVDQGGFANEANAVTYRLRAGFETGKFYDTTFLIEFDHIRDINGDFNSTTNGNTSFPVVADPDATELNRLQITNTSLPNTKLTLGRQRIVLDDARFVGNVGWRQNEQTFDAVRAQNTSLPGLTADFTWVEQVNRIFGDESAVGRFDSESALINLNYQTSINDVKIDITPFAYLLEFKDALALSSQTYGFNLSVSKDYFTLKGSYAHQSDYADQPTDYNVNYYKVAGIAKYKGFEAAVGYEVLGGDGTIGFSTPLATLHKFNGFADQFLATPADGLEDLYAKIGFAKKGVGPFALLKGFAVYHDFSAEDAGNDFGSEIDLVGVVKVKGLDNVTFLAKYAHFESEDGFKSDKDVFWLQAEFKF